MKQALLENDMGYLLHMAVQQEERGVHLLDVNVGLPEIDEPLMLERAVRELQAVTALPLQLDSSDPAAMERAMRVYNGKPLVNSVNGKQEVMDAVFPLVKKYGGAVICLTLDERGIPATAAERVAVAERIVAEAAKYGIAKKDLIFDTLAVTVSAEPDAARVTLDALREIRERLGCHTSLGVSNVSFGLPERDALNGVFFAMALQSGLSAAIVNPLSPEIMKTYYAFRALAGQDPRFADYLRFAEANAPQTAPPAPVGDETDLQHAIVKGLKAQSAALTEELLKTAEPLAIIEREVIPALNTVGEGFERKSVYLPQLLMSAEAAAAAFEAVRSAMTGAEPSGARRGPVVIATVRGDIHDIGKNTVKLLLENFGFAVTDLGKDVPPEAVADAVCRENAPICGLSALMTTTVPAMEDTIRLLRVRAPRCRVIVGGAVLTADYAASIGADYYARDAMETVRLAEKICG